MGTGVARLSAGWQFRRKQRKYIKSMLKCSTIAMIEQRLHWNQGRQVGTNCLAGVTPRGGGDDKKEKLSSMTPPMNTQIWHLKTI